MKKSFNIQKLLHCKFEHHETKPMHPSLSRAFQRYGKFNMKHPGLGDLSMTKQTELPCFIARLYIYIYIVMTRNFKELIYGRFCIIFFIQ